MNIDDFLKQPEFQSLDNYLTREMHGSAGSELIEKMKDILGSEPEAREWFYTNNLALGQRPYDLCKAGKKSEVEDLLGRIEHGVYS